MRLVTAAAMVTLALAIAVNDASAQRFRFFRGAARAVDNAVEATPRVRPRPTYPRVVSRAGIEQRLVSRSENLRQTLSTQAQRRRNVTSTDSRFEDGDEFISMADLIGWSLDLGVSFIEWESSSRTATEVAANRLARNSEYWPSFCPTRGRYYMVPSDQTACLDGSVPLIASAPMDLSAIPVGARRPSTAVDARRAQFDFDDYVSRDPIWSAYYFNFRTEFPAVWAALVDQINTGVRRGDAMPEVFDASKSLMINFVESQSVYVSYAETGPLIAIIDAEEALLQTLAYTSVDACAQYSLTGAFDAETAAALTEEQQAAFARASSALIDAMVSGRRAPVAREPVDQSRWDLLWKELLNRGIPDADIDALAAGAAESLPPDRVCRFGLEYSRALRELPINERADYVGDLFRVEQGT